MDNLDGKKIIDKYIHQGYLEKITFGDILYDLSKKYKDKIAIIDENKKFSYDNLWKDAYALAKEYLYVGIKKNDNILIQLPNGYDFIKCCFALFLIGAKPVLLLTSHREKDIEAIAKQVDAKVIITISSDMGFNYGDMAISIKNKVESINKIILVDKFNISLNLDLENISTNDFEDPPIYSDPALFLLSGGTTGVPKVIPKTHCGYIYNAKAAAKRVEITENDVYLLILSISHDYPLCNPGVIGTLCSGGTVVISKTSSFDEVFPLIEKYGVTVLQLIPVIGSMWLESIEFCEENYNLYSVKKIILGASKLDIELAKSLTNLFKCILIQGYGLGEGITCFTKCSDDFSIASTCQGTPISSGDIIKIVDENGREVEREVPGEVIEKGPYTFLGYYNAPDLNKEVFTEDGFFKTGDKAIITKEGNLKILGRVREQINRLGENVIPSEIETLLRKHNLVKEAAVVGIPDKDLVEKVCAFLVLDEGSKLTRAQVCEFLAEIRVASYKFPDEIICLENLPLKNIGKIDKDTLIKQYSSQEV